jgi:hypothetical protein
MLPQPHQPEGKPVLAAVITVAAVYVYFLIFAQFGFLKAVQAALGDAPGVIRPVMAMMGAGGIAGSILAARVFSPARGRLQFATSLIVCAAAAMLSRGAESAATFQGCALLVGLGIGAATVTLAAMLRRAVGAARLGLVIGCGTGLAYAGCNLPGVFDAGAAMQAWVAVLAALLGAVAGRALEPKFAAGRDGEKDYAPIGIVAWVVIFLALVCVDSAAFYLIQHTPDLKSGTWEGAGRLWVNAGVHLVAAVLAGLALDRGWLTRTTAVAAAALWLACELMSVAPRFGAAIALFYAAGVSVYSTVLVFYPAWSGRGRLAALVYAVAGWIGSGLGIGLAGGRTDLPGWFLPVAMGLIILALGVRLRGGRPAAASRQMNKD